MTEIRLYYPSDRIEQAAMDNLAEEFRALNGIEDVYLIGRRDLDWTEFVIVLTVVSTFVAEKFFGELIEEAAQSTCKAICDKLEQLRRRSLKGIPTAVYVEIEEDSTEINFRLDTRSTGHLQTGLSVLPQLAKELFGSMQERPQEVRRIRADLEVDSGNFGQAVGYDDKKHPTHVYDFEQKVWIPVSH